MDAETWKINIRDGFYKLETILREQVKAREALRAKRLALVQQERIGDYSPDYVERKWAEIHSEEQALKQPSFQKAQEQTGKIVELMEKRHAETLDYADVRLGNVLNLIDLAGSQMEHREMEKLVSQFVGNPAALKALRAVFVHQALPQGIAEVEKFLYEPAFVAQDLSSQATDAFLLGGSLNKFATKVNVVAQREGMTFPLDGAELIDPAGAEEAMRAAAGLTP